MSMTRATVATSVAILLFAVAVGGALVGGLAPPDVTGGPSGEPADETTTAAATTTADPQTDGGVGSATTTASGDTDPSYDFAIERVTECGRTCRDVTARLANAGTTVQEDVRVTTRVYADADLLWQGNETVGRLGPGESHPSTKRVKLGLADAIAVQRNDGYVTI